MLPTQLQLDFESQCNACTQCNIVQKPAKAQWQQKVQTYVPLHDVRAAIVVRQLCEVWDVLSSHDDNVVQQLTPAHMTHSQQA